MTTASVVPHSPWLALAERPRYKRCWAAGRTGSRGPLQWTVHSGEGRSLARRPSWWRNDSFLMASGAALRRQHPEMQYCSTNITFNERPAGGLTCIWCFGGSGLQDELALLVHLELLDLYGYLAVHRTVPTASLRHRVSHMTHLDAEGKLMTWD